MEMRDYAICCNIGHFDCEVDVSWLAKNGKKTTIKPQVYAAFFFLFFLYSCLFFPLPPLLPSFPLFPFPLSSLHFPWVTQVDMYEVPNGRHIILLAEGRLVKRASIFVTATGCSGIVRAEHFMEMRDYAICCNIGHFDCEVDVSWLAKNGKNTTIKPQVYAVFFFFCFFFSLYSCLFLSPPSSTSFFPSLPFSSLLSPFPLGHTGGHV